MLVRLSEPIALAAAATAAVPSWAPAGADSAASKASKPTVILVISFALLIERLLTCPVYGRPQSPDD
jgi:hypothetical protein